MIVRWVCSGSRPFTFVLALVLGTASACSPPQAANEPAGSGPPFSLQAPRDASDAEPQPLPLEPLPPEPPPPQPELVLGADGKPIGEVRPARYTSGAHVCPPYPEATCPMGKDESCEVHDRVTCRPECHGYRTQRYTCEVGKWGLRETLEPACRCAPENPPAELAGCTTRYVSVQPSDHSLTDGCRLGLSCGDRELWLECDGENDGTNTSLCECWQNRREQNLGGLFAGEGPDACFAAAAACSKAK